MARTPTKSANDSATAINSTVAESYMAENNNVKEVAVKKHMNNKISLEPLEDSDEIDVVSLIPNVSYKDNKTGDMYEWDEAGHIESMTFDTLKNMWRNHKGYFRNMWLKPNDDRVINKFGIAKVFEKYEFLMNESNYTRDNIKNICSVISDTPNELKYSVVNKIRNLIATGKLSDFSVIRELEKRLKLDLISLID